MAGCKVVVLERRGVVGGAAVTEEFHPGFRNSVASYTVSLLSPKVIADLRLAEHGLRIVERQIANFLPLDDGRYLKTGGGKTHQEVAKFSACDAERLDAYQARLEAVADVLRALALETPPNVVEGHPFAAIAELIKSGRIANRLRRLGLDLQRELLDLFTNSAGNYLDGWFESDPIKAVYGWDGVVGNYASPYTPGSAYVLLHHCFGEVNGKKGTWGHAIGGMGAITQAMAKSAAAHGAEIRVDAPVREVIVEKGRAVGVVTEKGEAVRARAVISNLNPKLLYLSLIDRAALPSVIRRAHREMALRLRHIPHERRACRASGLHLPARARPRRASHRGHHHRAEPQIHGAGLLRRAHAWLVEAADCRSGDLVHARRHARARRASMSQACSASMSRPNCRTASWDDHRETVADLMIDTVDRYAPNFKRSVLGRQIMSPLDLERTFGLVGGDIFHGALDLGQMFSARPMLGHADYRGPLPGLYMCGSGTHPGGGVTGLPGHNAAREVLRDLRTR